MVTIYKNIFHQKAADAHYIDLDKALSRISIGKSKVAIEELRLTQDKEKAQSLKKNLPCVLFSGKFTDRTDICLQEHSGYLVLDFDNVFDCVQLKQEVFGYDFVKASWISPSGNGVKALVRIADGSKHREHFEAIRDIFPQIDKSGINESRVCYESYDPEILVKTDVKPFAEIKIYEKVEQKQQVEDEEKFQKILIWLNNKGDSFVSGSRNAYIHKLASACCRFGIHEYNCISLILINVTSGDSTFTRSECEQAIKSAYKSNSFGSAEFEKTKFVDKITRKQIVQTAEELDPNVKPKDVIYGIDVKEDALNLYRNGYEDCHETGVSMVNDLFKFKKGELTLLTGIGNYGKSTFLKYLMVIQVVLFDKKIAIFSPEEAPAHEFYNDLVEIYLGCNCTPLNRNRPSLNVYESAYDRMTKNIFFIYPSELAPTPDYVKTRFLELKIKEKVEFCIIDPFNQMTNDYGKAGRSDKYLETLLSDFGRFAKDNSVYFIIVAHPKALQKKVDGNYPCPEVFDIADGAMWNNKMDNILVYHLPERQTNNDSTVCEFHSKKIRRRKSVGSVGMIQFEYMPRKRRFLFNSIDVLSEIMIPTQTSINPNKNIEPNTNFENECPF